ncbi:gamma-aminobutyric acid receptor subunit beta [Eurytemora carolleeae]|uniref:gamma-aminobutyric acid receptor subunit beta n=1 Tax=Eurytemora carolleeae TaxID=1294199 RepID=UPI000C758891|nr:gamma-aminobutyric acid receptor subunit beta [Eurytemora carolleeae]|eukprot:XP_023347848.1 gamma-aminobutyric acid receptor subunit beta-like [Eurytemora affinis]
MNVILGRNLLPIALNTYLPSILLVIISYVTVFFKPFFFEAVVTVNLTTLLVLVTLFVSVSNSLPPTSYIKMIDVYLIFCLLIPFTEVLLITIMDFLRIKSESGSDSEHGQQNSGQRTINHHGTLVTVAEEITPVENAAVPDTTDFVFVSRRQEVPTVRSILKADKRIQPMDLIQRNEKIEVEARQALYSHARKKGKILNRFKKFAVYGIPFIIVMFIAPYMIVGIAHVYSARVEAALKN